MKGQLDTDWPELLEQGDIFVVITLGKVFQLPMVVGIGMNLHLFLSGIALR